MSEDVLKAVIEALKKKCLMKEEVELIIIEKKSNIKKDALRKRRGRCLEKLKTLGLVQQRGEKYCWYIYPNLFKNLKNHNIKWEHSRLLIPALRELAGLRVNRIHLAAPHEEYVDPYEMEILTECAKEHLLLYKDIYSLLEDSMNKNNNYHRLKEQLEDNLKGKLRRIFGEPMDAIKGSLEPSFVGKNIPFIIYHNLMYGSSISLDLMGEDIRAFGQAAGGYVVAKGSQLFEKLKDFIKRETEDQSNIIAAKQVLKSERDWTKSHNKLKDEIRKLIIRIKGGETLRGECKTCPRVYFAT